MYKHAFYSVGSLGGTLQRVHRVIPKDGGELGHPGPVSQLSPTHIIVVEINEKVVTGVITSRKLSHEVVEHVPHIRLWHESDGSDRFDEDVELRVVLVPDLKPKLGNLPLDGLSEVELASTHRGFGVLLLELG